MEWVETTGRSVEEAKELALDRLGVDEADAEFELLEEPKLGLFGRLRSEARVRARVRPQAPPPKQDRRDRRRGSGGRTRRDDGSSDETAAPPERPAQGRTPQAPARKASNGSRRGASTRRQGSEDDVDDRRDPERPVPTEAQIAEQQRSVQGFLDGVLDAFGVEATVRVGMSEDGAIEAAIDGEDVGLLLGPRAATLEALQELARRALQQAHEDSLRLRVDVGGYRERRRQALATFAAKVATQVIDAGEPVRLEPMSAADRKVVHDTINGIDGVQTSSEGEEPRRRVVISPT